MSHVHKSILAAAYDFSGDYPVIRAAAAFIIATGTIAIGAFSVIGFGFIVLVDKIDLFVSASIYFSVFWFSLAFLFNLVRYVVSFYEFFSLSLGHIVLFRWLSLGRLLYIAFVFIAISFLWVFFEIFVSEVVSIKQLKILELKGLPSAAVCMVAIIILAPIILSSSNEGGFLHRRGLRQMQGISRAAMRLMLAGFFFSLGALWIDNLRANGPDVSISTDKEHPRRASIIMPANNGIIIYWAGDKHPSYLPLSEIRTIEGNYDNSKFWDWWDGYSATCYFIGGWRPMLGFCGTRSNASVDNSS